MRLEEIDLHGLGEFTKQPGGFRVKRYHIEEPWGYIYTTSKILLRLDQRGPDYVQFAPPGGPILLRRERYQTSPSLFVWIKTGKNRAFTNFFKPVVGDLDRFEEPEEFWCEYSPEKAHYRVKLDGIACDTELFVAEDEAEVVMSCTVTNAGEQTREIEVLPVMRPHLAAGSLAPWDVPSLYQKVGYSNESGQGFYLELRSPAGIPEQRQYGFVSCDLAEPDSAEVDYASFVGNGTFEDPEALWRGKLGVDASKGFSFGEWGTENSVDGRQGIVAVRKKLRLAPGEAFTFRVVLGSADAGFRERAVYAASYGLREFMGRREIKTPDEAFNRYVNEYLPLQLKWVSVLDRGWPTGMRGVRDHAQDTTALIPLDPDTCCKTLLALLEIQRSDGWFPRQYSTLGRQGTHDLRDYVDGGVWVWELLYDYLCWTKDFELLSERAAFLDSGPVLRQAQDAFVLRQAQDAFVLRQAQDAQDEATVLDHVLRLIGYYTLDANIGEHGLCLIRQGDWNDSVNRAGLEGRGESVMVTCQVVMMLRQAADLMGRLGGSDGPRAEGLTRRADQFETDLLEHALNEEGYLNGVFSDNGEWVFSPNDPDGRRRVSVPVNAFGIISGVLGGDRAARALDVLVALKKQDGWPLFDPPIGNPPIAKLGRIGQGDLAPGLGENGTPYNHGCHGFFGRAAAAAGRGDLLLEIMRYMLPYDQRRHPVERSRTAPYGVVNHWKTAPGVEGRGGECFLSGSISTALRNVYNGMFGIRPMLDCLAIDPALPGEWQEAMVRCSYLGAELEIVYQCCSAVGRLLVNGEEIAERRRDIVLEKEYLVIPDSVFEAGKRYEIRYM